MGAADRSQSAQVAAISWQHEDTQNHQCHFYKVRCGFFTVISAKRELIFFLLMYVFIRQPDSGKAPIEAIMPEASRTPLYQMINDPFGTVLGVENVKKNVKMADFSLKECIAV
jgi:hypothetical protein